MKILPVGTRSLLFGVHAFWWHPVTVWLAWINLYGLPGWRECVCIFIHDFGYWGCSDMDGADGRKHPWKGAMIADELFGEKYFNLVFCHSRYLCKEWSAEPSRLCWADKFSMAFDPQWFYLLRARLSGELREYRANAAAADFVPDYYPNWFWHRKLVTKLSRMAREHATK